MIRSRLLLLALLSTLVLVLSSCSQSRGGGRGSGDDDDSGASPDDDDTLPPGDDDDSAGTGPGPLPATSDVACGGGNGFADIYLLTLNGAVQVTVDTTSAATTFDPYAYLTTDLVDFATSPGLLEVGDDDVDCTFPPPVYSCPQFDTTHIGPAALVIYGYIDNCNSSSVGNYEVSVTGAGAPSTYDNLLDDYAL